MSVLCPLRRLNRQRTGLLPPSRCVGKSSVLMSPTREESSHTPATITEVVMSSTVETATEIRPFHVDIPEEKLAELRRRIEATRWPSKELVPDRSQGVQLATLQELARYWVTDYDWRKAQAKLNALPQFVTGIDGLDIHFIHIRSKHPDALPVIITHGWPGSVL